MSRPKSRDDEAIEPGAWGASPSEGELLVKAHALWLADPEAALAVFRDHERHHAARLAGCEAALAARERQEGARLVLADAPRFGDYLTLTRGVSYEREYVGWLRWVIGVLEERARAGGPDATP